jgi:hypothetical protein
VGPRTAAEVYQGDRPSGPGAVPPKAQKGAEILEKITGKLLFLVGEIKADDRSSNVSRREIYENGRRR